MCILLFLSEVALAVPVMGLSPRVMAFLSPTVTHDHRDGVVEFSWKRHRLFNHTACLVLYQMCMEVRRSEKV